MGHSRPLSSLFLPFQHLTVNILIIKFCRWLNSNCRPLVSKATALPTEPPQPLPSSKETLRVNSSSHLLGFPFLKARSDVQNLLQITQRKMRKSITLVCMRKSQPLENFPTDANYAHEFFYLLILVRIAKFAICQMQRLNEPLSTVLSCWVSIVG